MGEPRLDLEAENRALREELEHLRARLAEAERRSARIASLYVATSTLLDVSGQEAIDVIRDIVINLVGCEEMALLARDGDRLRSILSTVAPERLVHFAVGSGLVGRALGDGVLRLAPFAGEDAEPELSACVPLWCSGEVAGVLVLFGLLPHKDGFLELDRDLFALLSMHAGPAIFRAWGRR